jgi:hypothetical protein
MNIRFCQIDFIQWRNDHQLQIRFLDTSESLPFGVSELALPVSTLATTEIQNIENAFFVTDRTVFLTLPKLPKTLAFYAEYPPSVFLLFSTKNARLSV